MIVGTKGLVCNILSLDWSTYVVLSSKAAQAAYACSVSHLINACGAICRRA